MILKIDMSRAFDRVEWPFLLKILSLSGFPPQFTHLIEQCITTPTFSILINGGPVGNFSSQRGLRQGNPLSPLLFIICTEALSRLLTRKSMMGSLKVIKIARNCDPLTHLLFADDLLVFGRANEGEAETIADCLATYESWSGQLINKDKSVIHYSNNANRVQISTINSILGLKKAANDAKYLGLPFLVSRSRRRAFQPIVERLDAKLQGWKAKLLSYAGRATLIKSTALAMPTYAMQAFLLPKTIYQTLDGKIRDFWWGHNKTKKTMCTKSWDFICRPKNVGGLGFRRTYDMNVALMAKLGWQMISQKTKLWSTQMGRKYCSRHSFLKVDKQPGDSPTWK